MSQPAAAPHGQTTSEIHGTSSCIDTKAPSPVPWPSWAPPSDDFTGDERILPVSSRHVRIATGGAGRKPVENTSDLSPPLRIKSDAFDGIHVFSGWTVEQLDPERIGVSIAQASIYKGQVGAGL